MDIPTEALIAAIGVFAAAFIAWLRSRGKTPVEPPVPVPPIPPVEPEPIPPYQPHNISYLYKYPGAHQATLKLKTKGGQEFKATKKVTIK